MRFTNRVATYFKVNKPLRSWIKMRYPRCALIITLGILLIYGLLFISDADDRLHYFARDWKYDFADKAVNVWLDDYRLDLAPVSIAEIERNLSGLTYAAEDERLYAITNGPTRILQLSTSGKLESWKAGKNH